MVEFDFDKMAKLAKDDPTAFEMERQRLIGAQLAEMPEAQRRKCLAVQYDLDLHRFNHTDAEHFQYIKTKMFESLEDLQDQLTALLVTLEKGMDTKPRLEAINQKAFAGDWFTKL
jgi:hypothetical protein